MRTIFPCANNIVIITITVIMMGMDAKQLDMEYRLDPLPNGTWMWRFKQTISREYFFFLHCMFVLICFPFISCRACYTFMWCHVKEINIQGKQEKRKKYSEWKILLTSNQFPVEID